MTPVTTKAQLSAKSEDNANNVKPEMYGFLSKIKKSAEGYDILESRLTPTCGHGVALMQGFTEAWAEKDKVW